MKKRVVVLGATGSIGRNACAVLQYHAACFEVIGLAACNSVELLAEQGRLLHAGTLIAHTDKLASLRQLAVHGTHCDAGEEAMIELVTRPDVDCVLCAIVGIGGLKPVLAALRAGKQVALASKEVMVMAGELVRAELQRSKGSIIPVDSEHSAIFQCLNGSPQDVDRVILTASGGAFRDATDREIKEATYERALAHPVWQMGPKVTIDSASLMNKALEIVEAAFLFDLTPEQIEVVIHPQSIIHSMVRFRDRCVLAQLSLPDMRFAIQYALTWPDRLAGPMEELDFSRIGNLSFARPDRKRFPSLDFAYESLRVGGTLPAVMNAANEIAVEKFRVGAIAFPKIWSIIEEVMARAPRMPQKDIENILAADAQAREMANNIL